jgi:Asp-tRNA(Asn)/Glu-tRNA(Gln) amidotransferase A subunit family amidase
VTDLADNSTAVISNYSEVVDFIEKIDQVGAKFEESTNKLSQLDSLTDVNKIVASIEDSAKTFTALGAEVRAVSVPQDFKQYQADVASLMDDMAAIFTDLAKATKAYDLKRINAASDKIDAVVTKADKVDKDVQLKVNQDSAFIKSVKALQVAADALKI